MSFEDIMREQEDERMARQIQTYQTPEEIYWNQLELAKKLSKQEAKCSAFNSVHDDAQDTQQIIDKDLAFAQQLQDDETFAYYLQKQERKADIDDAQSTLKTLTPLEYKLYNLQFGVDDPNRDAVIIEEDTEYNYTEPFSEEQNQKQIEPPVIYDSAQRREDKEIAHVTKRMVEKRVNAIPVALHHKEYAPRKKGKSQDLHIEQKKVPSKNSASNATDQNKPIQKAPSNAGKSDMPLCDDEHAIGIVLRDLGGTRYIVFCYKNCSEKLCRLTGKMKFRKVWIYQGDIVLIKLRDYQYSRADIIYKYSPNEYKRLVQLDYLKTCDPKKMLTPDLFDKLLTYLDPTSKSNFLEMYKELNYRQSQEII